jgi:hypothetical protein
MARAGFLGWSRPRPGYQHGLIGPAAERVLHASLLEAAPHGYRLTKPERGEVGFLLGRQVAGGRLDSAAFLQLVDKDGRAGATVVTPIEVKNIRHWIYPNSAELFQLLHKAALLQQATRSAIRAGLGLSPPELLWAMAKELGFFPIEVRQQYVLPGGTYRPCRL